MRCKSIFLLITALIMLTYNCRAQIKSAKINNFEEYIRSLPLVNLPYTVTCGTCCQGINLDIDSLFIKKYELEWLFPIGKVFENKKFIGVLYFGNADHDVPVLVVYDKIGNKISKQNFLSDFCGRFLDFYGESILEIDKSINIKEIDTAYVFRLDSIKFSIQDTLEKHFNVKDWIIDINGEIITK